MGASHHPACPAGEGAGVPRKDTTTNHVASRLSPHRAWEPSKNPQDQSGQIGTLGAPASSPARLSIPRVLTRPETPPNYRRTKNPTGHIPCRRGRRRSREGHHHKPRSFPTFAASGLGAKQEPTRSVRANRHPGSAGALAGPSLHSGQPLPSGNTAKPSMHATTEPQTTAGRSHDD